MKKNIEKDKFLLEIDIATGDKNIPIRTLSFKYGSLKLLRQGRKRKESQYFCILDDRKYIKNGNGEYEPFGVFGNAAIPLSILKAAARRLELEEQEKKDWNSPLVSKHIPMSWK